MSDARDARNVGEQHPENMHPYEVDTIVCLSLSLPRPGASIKGTKGDIHRATRRYLSIAKCEDGCFELGADAVRSLPLQSQKSTIDIPPKR